MIKPLLNSSLKFLNNLAFWGLLTGSLGYLLGTTPSYADQAPKTTPPSVTSPAPKTPSTPSSAKNAQPSTPSTSPSTSPSNSSSPSTPASGDAGSSNSPANSTSNSPANPAAKSDANTTPVPPQPVIKLTPPIEQVDSPYEVRVFTSESPMLSRIINQIPQATNYIRSSLDVVLADASIVDHQYIHLVYNLSCRRPNSYDSSSSTCYKEIDGIHLTSYVSLKITDDEYKNPSNLIVAIPIDINTISNKFNQAVTLPPAPQPFLSNSQPNKTITVNYRLSDLQAYHGAAASEINRYNPDSFELFGVLTKVDKLIYNDGVVINNSTLDVNPNGSVSDEQEHLLEDPTSQLPDKPSYKYQAAPKPAQPKAPAKPTK